MIFRQARWGEGTIFDDSKKRTSLIFKTEGEIELPKELERISLSVPGYSEIEAVRHYTRLSQEAYGVDNGPVPLGSCTMKYNPKLATLALEKENFANIHPAQLINGTALGFLELMYELQEWFKEITGMDSCSLQPPAGASGELAGILIIKKSLHDKGLKDKEEILVPDSAHGSNAASSAMGGFRVVRIPTDSRGLVDLDALKFSISEKTAGLMLTNPNTLGLFEENIEKIAELIHASNGLLYYDGANLNGIIGIARPGDMGFDIVHLNLHKTFSAPHGGGGPGAGAICVKKELEKYLPGIIVEKNGNNYALKRMESRIGDMYSMFGNFPGMLYAYIFILAFGGEIYKVAEYSTLNTNYFIRLLSQVRGVSLPFSEDRPRLHEAVLSFKKMTEETGATVEDIAKYLINSGVYAPTIYFPLIVEEAFMIEFTESETRENIEKYAELVKDAVNLAYTNVGALKKMPENTSVGRLDALKANHPSTMIPSIKFRK